MDDLQGTSTGSDGQRGWKAVYTIVERAGSDKKHWIRIGTAFVNRDQSLNVRLDATPTNGQLHIRDAEPYDANAPRRRPDPLSGFGGVA
jgi:hypothetical protein